MPIGIQLTGARWTEHMLLTVAWALEDLARHASSGTGLSRRMTSSSIETRTPQPPPPPPLPR